MQTTSKINNRRIYWIDFGKVLTAFLVVWAHVLSDSGKGHEIQNYLFSFHVPVFFFISGLFHKKSERIQWCKYVKRLVFPALLFLLLDGLVYVIVETIKDHSISVLFAHAVNYVKYDTLSIIRGTILNPCWFLFALFWCKVLADIFLTIKKRWFLYLLVLAGLLIPYLFSFRFPVFISQGFMAFPFYLSAYYCSNYIKALHPSWKYLAHACILFAVSSFLYTLNGKVSMNGFYFGQLPLFLNIIVFYLNAFIGSFMILAISLLPLPELRFVKRLATSLITILGVQGIFLRIHAATFDYSHINNGIIPITILVSIVIMSLCYFVHQQIGGLYAGLNP